jgi:hypothetical protein
MEPTFPPVSARPSWHCKQSTISMNKKYTLKKSKENFADFLVAKKIWKS